jgi:3-methyl-2-oxobutanoate hydroxymethyltransferase
MLDDAIALQNAGAFAIVLELTPRSVAAKITQSLEIPTIGIGSGPECDGQVLVITDMLGLIPNAPAFRHARRYANLAPVIEDAARQFCADVESGVFPAAENSFD